tara:strand:+ start:50 stop:190 length:141 start_codon:yes stop_codon:yes gene_type:complete
MNEEIKNEEIIIINILIFNLNNIIFLTKYFKVVLKNIEVRTTNVHS